MNVSANQWWNIRILLLCVAAVYGAVMGLLPTNIPFGKLAEMPAIMKSLLAIFILFSLAAIPLMVVIVILLQSVNPFSDKFWERPTQGLIAAGLITFIVLTVIVRALGSNVTSPRGEFVTAEIAE